MLKKSVNFKGYIFLESLLSLTILTVMIGSYLSVNSFLIMKAKEHTKRLTMQRILYEEVKHYEIHGYLSGERILRENERYIIKITQNQGKVIQAVIENGGERFSIERQ